MNTRRRFFFSILLMPAVTTSVGVDAGPVFQIAATENLGLKPEVVGVAFGLGVVSVPLQLWAARMPLWRARSNLQLFALFTAAQCAVMALLLGTVDPGDRLATAALVIAVLAEINVSVLLAPSWQPLLSVALSSTDRQAVNSRGGAGSLLTRAGVAVLFGALALTGRVVFFVVAAAVALAVGYVLRGIPAPDRPAPEDQPRSTTLPTAMRPLYVAIGLVAAGAWPLFVVYVDDVLWPDINLGLVAGVQLTGSLLASALWRATTAAVAHRARWAAGVSLACTVALLALSAPIDTTIEEAVFFAAVAITAAATSTMMLTIMELSHRVIDESTSVKAMTVYDVVASTSMQAGLLVAGFLIAASRGAGRVDPYRVFLIATAAVTLVVTARLSPPRRGRRSTAPPDIEPGSGLGLGAAVPPGPLHGEPG